MKNWIKKVLRSLRGELDIDKLKRRGLKIGQNCTIMGGVIIDPSHCWHITIGNNVTLAPNVHVLAHDASTKVFLNYTRVANTKLGDNVFVGAGTIVLPGVTIGSNVVIGAGSVVSKDIPDDSVAVGNPARVVKPLKVFLEEHEQRMKPGNVFDEKFTLRNPSFGDIERKALLEAYEKHGEFYVE